MELYSNMYQYLRQSKLKGYWGMKTSGEVSYTEKLDLNASFVKAMSAGMQSKEETAVQEKLGKIRAKLKAGARLTAMGAVSAWTHSSFQTALRVWRKSPSPMDAKNSSAE